MSKLDDLLEKLYNSDKEESTKEEFYAGKLISVSLSEGGFDFDYFYDMVFEEDGSLSFLHLHKPAKSEWPERKEEHNLHQYILYMAENFDDIKIKTIFIPADYILTLDDAVKYSIDTKTGEVIYIQDTEKRTKRGVKLQEKVVSFNTKR